MSIPKMILASLCLFGSLQAPISLWDLFCGGSPRSKPMTCTYNIPIPELSLDASDESDVWVEFGIPAPPGLISKALQMYVEQKINLSRFIQEINRIASVGHQSGDIDRDLFLSLKQLIIIAANADDGLGFVFDGNSDTVVSIFVMLSSKASLDCLRQTDRYGHTLGQIARAEGLAWLADVWSEITSNRLKQVQNTAFPSAL